jgi:hypothetical protein
MRPLNMPEIKPEKGKWRLDRDVLVIRTDGRQDIIGHRVVSLTDRKATFDPERPFILTRVR